MKKAFAAAFYKRPACLICAALFAILFASCGAKPGSNDAAASVSTPSDAPGTTAQTEELIFEYELPDDSELHSRKDVYKAVYDLKKAYYDFTESGSKINDEKSRGQLDQMIMSLRAQLRYRFPQKDTETENYEKSDIIGLRLGELFAEHEFYASGAKRTKDEDLAKSYNDIAKEKKAFMDSAEAMQQKYLSGEITTDEMLDYLGIAYDPEADPEYMPAEYDFIVNR